MSNIQTTDYSSTIIKSLLWRHNSAEALTAIIIDEQDFYDTNVKDFLNQWYDDVFNIDTANLFGLVVWSIILRLPISIAQNPVVETCFGFGPDDDNFDQEPFCPENADNVLTPADARLAVKLRYRQLTTNASVENVNRILEDVFSSEGIAYVIDNGDMTAEYVFEFSVSADLVAVITKNDLLPRPVGVGVTLTIIP